MTLEPLQQWYPAIAILALHRVSHPEWVLPVARAAWRLLKRSKPVVEEIAPLAERAVVAAAAAQPEPQSTPEKQPMKLNLANLAGAMAKAAAAVSTSSAFAPMIYEFGAKIIGAVETAYAANGAGAHKKAAVTAAMQTFIDSLSSSPTGPIFSEFEAWLESVIGAYNAAASVVNVPVAPSAPLVPTAPTAEDLNNLRAAYGKAEPIALTLDQLARATLSSAPASAANTQGI